MVVFYVRLCLAQRLISLLFFLGLAIPESSFYSCHNTRSRRLEETTDTLFRDIDNGYVSNVEGEIDGSSDSGDELEQPEPDEADHEDESRDDDSEASTSAWRWRTFVKPDTTFHGEEFAGLEAGKNMPSPYAYFSHYVPKSVFIELAEKTNRYSVLQKGKSVSTDEQEIRKLIGLHLVMGVMRLYWKPEMNTTLVASTELSCSRFEKLRNNLHIVDTTQPDPDDRLWKVRPPPQQISRKVSGVGRGRESVHR